MSLFDLNLPDSFRHDVHNIAQELAATNGYLREIAFILRVSMIGIPTTGLMVVQRKGGKDMPITGVKVGATGSFRLVRIPANGSLQQGSIPQWQTGDASVTLTPAGDGSTCDAAVSATETLPSFGLTVNAVSSDGTALSKTVSIPVLAADVVPASSIDIDQIS